MKVIAIQDDGTQVDVTEPVQVAYDCVVGSMDWGSGFLGVEEVDSIIRLSAACGFSDFEDIVRSVWADRRALELNKGKTAFEPHVSNWWLAPRATEAELAEFKEGVLRPKGV